MAQKDNNRSWMRVVLAALTLTVLGGLGLFGWQWLKDVHVERIEVTGIQHAEAAALVDLAQVDTSQRLLDLDPALVADRVQRHPWVAVAEVTRLPTGTLLIGVEERIPVALVIDGHGRPTHYLDRDGFPLPVVEGAVYDVPLLRGLGTALHPMRPVEHDAVRALVAGLASLDPGIDALISDFEVRGGDIWLQTAPAGKQGSIPVRLGRDDFASKLRTLYAFWHQAILTQPEKTFEWIDLRFASQIVTREAEG